uniref:ADP-ribosylation factor-like protein 2-binding protein n=3 Tax=Clastoptera arizonana TaxID=38151 RepID=A0A1B6CZI9_9HEMI
MKSFNFVDMMESTENYSYVEGSDFEIEFNNSSEMTEFDFVIGCIEDIIIDEEFQTLQKDFMEKYWEHFEDGDENKLIYTTIFNEYNNEIEDHIEKKLRHKVPDFCMNSFIENLVCHKQDLEGEVFEMLFTFSDFLAFKEMFLEYKNMKEGRSIDLSQDIVVTSLSRSN